MPPRIFLSPPDVGPRERALLLDAFDSNWIAPLGPHVDGFERELAACVGTRDAAAVSSGTAGLHLALLLLGVQAGDEVLTASFTFAATANAISYTGAQPVFVDSDSATWQMDPELLATDLDARAASGRLPAAVVVVDLYGRCADYDRIVATCHRYSVPVVEDAAEALGATYRGRPAGSLADLGVFSFNGNKILTTSGGGMLVGDDEALIARARHLATQARDPAPHYEHSVTGYNYRLSNLLAAVGRAQLESLDDKVAARRAINTRYRAALGAMPGLAFMPEADYGRGNGWLTCLTIDQEAFGASAEQVRLALAEADIEARPVWKPMHLQPLFCQAPMVGGQVSEDVFAHGLCLPSGSSLRGLEQDEVIAIVSDCAAL